METLPLDMSRNVPRSFNNYPIEVDDTGHFLLQTMRFDEFDYPLTLSVLDAMKLLSKYDPEWDNRLYECMRLAIKDGSLTHDDYVSVLKF